MASVRDVIRSSLRKIGAVAAGETPTAAEEQDALKAFNSLLENWFGEGVVVFASVKETKTLTASDAEYTWGSGGDITTTRPNEVLGAFIRDGTTDHPIDIIGERQYRGISDKSTEGRPEKLFYQPEYPLGKIYLYFTPNSAYALHLWSRKVLAEVTAIAGDVAFPPQYKRAIEFNLAVDIAPEWGRSVSPEIASVARVSYDRLVALNAARQLEPVAIEAFKLSRRYSIENG